MVLTLRSPFETAYTGTVPETQLANRRELVRFCVTEKER
jgi:hypothetical protein